MCLVRYFFSKVVKWCNIIKKQLNKMYEEPSDKDISKAKKQIIEILKDKKSELKECKKKRESYKKK